MNGSGGATGLPAMDRGARLARVRDALAEGDLGAVVVTKPQNVRWLVGFTGSAAIVVVTGDSLTLITDDRYRTMADEQLDAAAVEARVVIDRDPSDPLRAAVGSAGPVGLEAGHVTWARARDIEGWLGGTPIVATHSLLEGLRRDKDQGERARLARAAAIADEALGLVAPGIVAGRTERDLARELDRAMVDLGADGLSFTTIVASGPNSAKPHAVPSDRAIAPGDPVVIDFGASVDGYGSDMTRSFLVDPVDPVGLERFGAVEEAQAAGVAAVAAGVEERAVDAACRDALTARGMGDAFTHGTGHGIGLEIHEDPFLSVRSTGRLRAGWVVTVEPGIYLPGWGGIRIEDSVEVTDGGCVAITRFGKDHRVPA
jgi:Xaa-Pro aminopeptidase